MLNFNPSKIKNELYEVMEDFEISIGSYCEGITSAIFDFFAVNYPDLEYVYEDEFDNDVCGAVKAIAWVEKGHPQLVTYHVKF